MLNIGFILAIIVFINFFYKKNLYTSNVIGLILLIFYLVGIKQISLNTLYYKSNLVYVLYFIIWMAFLITLKYTNDILRYTKTKNEIIELLNFFLKDKKLKILFLLIASLLLYKTPLMGILFMIFLASFLNISRYNMIIIPFVFIIINNIIMLVNTQLLNFSNMYTSGFKIIIIYYLFIYLFYILENDKDNKQSRIGKLLDVSYLIILFVVNFLAFILLNNIFLLYQTLIFSLIFTFIVANYLIKKYPVFANRDKKLSEQVNISKIHVLSKTNIPYLIIISLFSIEIFLYLFILKYTYLGMIFFIVFNFTFVYKFSNEENKHNINLREYSNFIIVMFLVLIVFFLIKNSGKLEENLFVDLNNNKVSKSNLTVLLKNLFTFTFLPFLKPLLSSDIVNAYNITLNQILVLKIAIIVIIQGLLNSINLLICDFVFSIKKEDLTIIFLLMVIISMVLQIVIFLL